jgi:hypothetical protein
MATTQLNTHENIHTGLSGLGEDSKWVDMLNFRCANRRTKVVPHKFVLKRCCGAGLHTLISGLDGHNFAIGSGGSFGFVGAENFRTYPLWRLNQKFLPALDDRDAQSQRLVVKGVFTGDRPTRLRVHYIDGKLIPFWAVEEPAEEPPDAPPIDYGCEAVETITVSGTITNADTEEPVAGVLVEFKLFGFVAYTIATDEDGHFEIENFNAGTYSYRLSKSGYTTTEESLFIGETEVLDRELTSAEPVVENLLAFMTVPMGAYDLSSYFASAQLDLPVHADQWWRLHTDECGANIEYARARINSSGMLTLTDFVGPTTDSYFSQTPKDFISDYAYAEGMYLQVGYIDPDTLDESWPTLPCIS